MTSNLVILMAEDNEGHAILVKRNLVRAGINNEIIHFWNGAELLDFLYKRGDGPHRKDNISYLLLLDIRMPVVDGMEVLENIKRDEVLRVIPVIMLTTTDDPQEIEMCHELGCSVYIVKPVDFQKFFDAIRTLGLFISIIEVPKIK